MQYKRGRCLAYQLRQVNHVANVLEQALGDDEAPRQRLPGLLLDQVLEHVLEVLHVVVLVPLDGAAADLHALADGKVDGLVGDDDVAALAERGDDAGDGGKGLRVDDARRHAQVRRDVCLGLHVHVLRAVEAGRAAGADAIGAQRLDGLLLERLVADEVVVVVRREVRDGAPVGELRLGACGSAPASVRASLQLRMARRLAYPTMTGRFSLSSSSWAVGGATSGSGVHSSTSSSISYSAMSTRPL
jgi:hypothetical protein